MFACSDPSCHGACQRAPHQVRRLYITKRGFTEQEQDHKKPFSSAGSQSKEYPNQDWVAQLLSGNWAVHQAGTCLQILDWRLGDSSGQIRLTKSLCTAQKLPVSPRALHARLLLVLKASLSNSVTSDHDATKPASRNQEQPRRPKR
jgi:hypothetical protein